MQAKDQTSGRGARRPDGPGGGLPAVISRAPEPDERDPTADEDGLLQRAGRVAASILHVLMPVLLLTALAVGLGYVRLMHGPISLKPIAKPIAAGIGAELPGLDVRIDDAVLRLAQDGGLEFRLRNVSLIEQDGDLVASAPEAAAQLSYDALWAGRIVPSRVDLIAPRLSLAVGEDGSVAMTFSPPPLGDGAVEGSEDGGGTSGASAPPAGAKETAAPPPAAASPAPARRRDLFAVLLDSSRRARKGLDATTYLREIGMRDVTVDVESRGARSVWVVPEVSVDLEHRKRSSVVSGLARINSARGPWTVTFRSEENERTSALVLTASVRDLVPASIENLPGSLAALAHLDVPVAVDATVDVATSGAVRAAVAAVEVGRGKIELMRHASGAVSAIDVDGALLQLAYDPATQSVALKPSQVRWNGSRATLEGVVAPARTTDGRSGWSVDLKATEGLLAAADLGLPPVALDRFAVAGHWLPASRRMQLTELALKAGGAELTADGEMDEANGAQNIRIEARAGAMPLATFKTLWPRALASDARRWVGEHVEQASPRSLTVRYLSGSHFDVPAGASRAPRLTLALEAGDLSVRPIKAMSPVEAPRALIRLEGDALEVSVPDAAYVLGPGRRVPLKTVRFAVADVHARGAAGELTFKAQGALPPALELLAQEPLALFRSAGGIPDGLDGKVEGQFKLMVPLEGRVAVADLRPEGKARIFDAKAGKSLVPGYDVQGATVQIDLTPQAIDAKGEMLVSGVNARLAWQHLLDAPPDRQPPLRISATLDQSDRNQLGLDVNHIVQGTVPLLVTVEPKGRDQPSAVRVRADLTSAELVLEGVAWTKAPGRSAFLDFDIVKPKPGRTELQNLQLKGDDVAIEGWAALGPDSRFREFHLPTFTLNLVTRLDIAGRLQGEIWDIKVKGSNFDGREFFRALFSMGQVGDKPHKPLRPRDGIDVEADIDNVMGFEQTNLKAVKLKLSKRAERLVSLQARGSLAGQPVVASVAAEAGQPRRLLADTADAGQAMKLVGFYPNVQGGRARLEVNLDGKGAADKTGLLRVEDFAILGDPVVAEVVGSVGADTSTTERQRVKSRVVRQAFQFDRMMAPFSVGHGQFVLAEAYLRGPLLGASIRGKVDYRSSTVNLGGTYVPLQGLNNVLGDIPLLGQLLSGPRSEGIFGITFAIQGPMASPQVIVNPLSLVAPGIFREIFQMTPVDPAVQVRDERRAAPQPAPRTRASSAPAEQAPPAARVQGSATPGGAGPGVKLDGWSSETKGAPPKQARP